MANVIFKRGLQANLTAEKTPFQDGAFYLTTDTGRLYADVVTGGTSERVLLNRTIEIVESIADLTAKSARWTTAQAKADHKNDIYYVSSITTGAQSTHAGNILAIWNGQDWVQINPDTNTTLSDATYTAIVSNNTATISQTITSNDGDSDVSSSFSITGANGITVSQTTNDSNNSGVTISGSAYEVATSLTGSNEIANITLSSSNTALSASTATFIAGENITFSTTNTGSVQGIVVSSIDNYVTSASFTANSAGTLGLNIARLDGESVTATISNLKVMLEDGNYLPLVSSTSGNQGAVYSKSQIDRMFTDLNGMQVVGTIGASGTGSVTTLPTLNVHQGDTYIVVTDGWDIASGATFDSHTTTPAAGSAKIGDMVIARGTEVSGEIPSANLTWFYIPSGNDDSEGYTYRGSANTGSNTLVLADGNSLAAAGIQLVAGTDMAISSTSATPSYDGFEGAGEQLVSTISHAAITTTTSTTSVDAAEAFVAIKNITVNNGHITGISYGSYEPNTYSLDSITISNGTRSTSSSSANDVNVALTLIDLAGTTQSTTMKLASSSINLSQGSAANIVQMDLVWGEF